MLVEKHTDIENIAKEYYKQTSTQQSNLFEMLEWFSLLQKHILLENEEAVYYCIKNTDNRIEGIFPLIKCMKPDNTGYMLKSLSNFYSMEYRPFFAKMARNSKKAANIFADYLTVVENGWTSLELSPVDDGELSHINFIEEMSEYYNITSSLCHKNWIYRNHNETYENYIKHSPSRIKDIQRKERRLKKNHTVQFKIWCDETDIEICIKDYFRVYDNSWKDEENYPGFIPDLIKLCAQKKMLRLGILYIDDVPAAAQFNIFHDNTTLIYKLSYREDHKKLSAGAVLSFKMMEYAFDKDKSQEIDYGCGDDAYKKEWMNNCRKKMTITIYNNNSSGKRLFFKQSWKARIKYFLTSKKYREI